jgi:capsular exopolysaccharide synthesis family protein
LFRLRHHPDSRILLITSPNPEEGKTSVSLNLAAAFQQNHLKVLLIDGDLRKPRMHKVLGIPAGKGIADVLESQLSIDQAIQKNVGGLGVDFLSCGSSSNHPTEILGSDLMEKLMKELKKIYDIVIVDSPPYLAVADVAVLSEYADALIFVSRYQKTDRRHLKNLKRRFRISDQQIMGVVINRVSVREKDYYYHQYYYYGYGDADRQK